MTQVLAFTGNTISVSAATIAEFTKKSVKNFLAERHKNAMTRKAIRELSSLTDRELADMGITRGDIRSVVTGSVSDYARHV